MDDRLVNIDAHLRACIENVLTNNGDDDYYVLIIIITIYY